MNQDQQSILERAAAGLRASPLLRLVAMGGLTLLLLVPIDWIGALIAERMVRRAQAVDEVASKWGRAQTVLGPFLSVPYEHRWTEERSDRRKIVKTERRVLTIIPSDLRMHAQIDGEERARGIFSVPVYRVTLDISGTFAMPDLAGLGIAPELVDWGRSALGIGISDARTIQSRGVEWNGGAHPFLPGPGPVDISSGIHAPIANPFAVARPTFALQLAVNGSAGLYFTPAGQETAVIVASNWPSPSFQGNWLPATRSVATTGFEATWEIPFLGRNQTAAWTSETSQHMRDLATATFGVDLVTPVDAHRMSDRSVKYARLFIVLTFATIWLIEVLHGLRVHPIQYLLIGCALCTFYLLELSLAEQVGFASAYVVASGAIVALIGLYAAAVLHGRQRAAIVTITVGALYAYLYVVLTNEDYALLLGSLVLFGALAVTMLATRRIDWYSAVGRLEAPHDVTTGS